MKRNILIGVILVLILLLGGAILKGLVFKPANAGLKVEAIPPSAIFLEGKEIGKTPFITETLSPGEKTLKLVPEKTIANFYPWETKIKLTGGVMIVVNREFGETESQSSGEIITLEKITDKKTTSLMVISTPDSALVKVGGESKGFTPLLLEKLPEQEIEISLSAAGFQERTIRTKLVSGYKTTVNSKLAESKSEEITGTPTPSPTGKPISSPTPKPTGPTPTTPPKPYVQIKQTPTGWLRVRLGPSKTATEAARVYPGERYSLLSQESGWYKILYEKTKEGWISGDYAEKFE